MLFKEAADGRGEHITHVLVDIFSWKNASQELLIVKKNPTSSLHSHSSGAENKQIEAMM